MVNTIVEGTFRQTNLTNESAEYLAKREELRPAEIELMKQRERVAELRRHLPGGAAIQDYKFEEGPRDLNAGDLPVRPSSRANFASSNSSRDTHRTGITSPDKSNRRDHCPRSQTRCVLVSPRIIRAP